MMPVKEDRKPLQKIDKPRLISAPSKLKAIKLYIIPAVKNLNNVDPYFNSLKNIIPSHPNAEVRLCKNYLCKTFQILKL